MSAWICSNRHINIVVTAYAGIAGITDPAELQRLAELLIAENYTSVNYRYNENDAPGPIVYRHEVVGPAAAHKAARCLDYQSCEHPSWEDSEAFRVVQAVRQSQLDPGDLPGIPWGFPPYRDEDTCTD